MLNNYKSSLDKNDCPVEVLVNFLLVTVVEEYIFAGAISFSAVFTTFEGTHGDISECAASELYG